VVFFYEDARYKILRAERPVRVRLPPSAPNVSSTCHYQTSERRSRMPASGHLRIVRDLAFLTLLPNVEERIQFAAPVKTPVSQDVEELGKPACLDDGVDGERDGQYGD
jgi:hypothetical protein